MSAAAQWTTIGWMILCGVLMGTAFDTYRVAAGRFRVPRWLLPALDVAYWAAATLGVFSVLLDNNHGEVRMYVFLGLGIGVSGYFGLLSHRVVKTVSWLLGVLISLTRWIWKMFRLLFVIPFLGVVRLLARLLDIAFVVTAAILLWTAGLLLLPLKPAGRHVWRLLLPLRRKWSSWTDRLKRYRNRIKAAWDLFRKPK